MLTDCLASGCPWLSEQWERLGSAFEGARLNAPGAQTDPRFGNHLQHSAHGGRLARTVVTAQAPGEPDLHGVLEAELARDLVGQQGRLGHQEPDDVVGEQIHPEFFAGHLRSLAAQVLHAKRCLDVAQVQLP
jgi:hypothetical protein